MNRRLRAAIIYLVGMLAFVGCKGPDESPELRYIENLNLTDVKGKTAYLSGDAVFYNPNDVKMTLRGVDVVIWIEGKKIGKILQDNKIKIPPSDEFRVALDAEVEIEDLGIVSTILNVLGGKKFEVKYVGHIKATMKGLPVKVPVDYTGEVRLR